LKINFYFIFIKTNNYITYIYFSKRGGSRKNIEKKIIPSVPINKNV